jgi:tetratricopeptide (TPR) repeat protein
MTSSDLELRGWNASLVVIALLFAACLAIYGQTVAFGFINLDDNLYVYQNSYVAAGLNLASLKWAFTTFHSANWHPLTWISHMVDVTLFGMKPGVHHFINVLFHAANTVLVFVVFGRLTGDTWKSAIVAFLFAVHPAHVESVAWISERKDVLSTLFWLLTMLAYIRFVRDEGASGTALTKKYGSSNYLLAILCFALGLMAKPMLVTLPFVLILIDYWPLKRVQKFRDLPRLILEKAPFFALSLASCAVTLIAQRASGAVESFDGISIVTRSMNALSAYVRYIAMLFYPHDLGVWYPPSAVDGKFAVIALIALVAISIICVWQSATRRYLLFGWLWFLGTLVPVIGIVQVGGQSMADRYTYIPSIGIFIMSVWAGAEVMDRLRLNAILRTAVPVVIILVLVIAAHIQTRYWHDNETLYVRTLNVTGDNFLIAHNLCYVYVFSDRYAEAQPLCERSIELNPNFADAQNTLGILQLKQNRLDDSERTFRNILDRWPGYVPAYPNIAAVLISREQPEEAEKFLENAARMTEGSIDRTTWTEPVKNLADLYAAQNKMEKAAENYARAIFLEPNRADLRLAAASVLYRNAKYDDALRQLQPAIALDPNNADAFYMGGKIYAAKGMQADAVQMLERAIAIRPDFSEARATLSEISGGRKND